MLDRLTQKTLAVIALITLGGCATMNRDKDEQAVSFDRAPAAVQATIHKIAGDGKMSRLTKETEHGKPVYEAEFTTDGVERSVTVNEAGDLLEEESEIQISDLPAVVRTAAMRKYPDAKFHEAAMLMVSGVKSYEVELATANQKRELKFTADGAIQTDRAKHNDGDRDKDLKMIVDDVNHQETKTCECWSSKILKSYAGQS